MEAILWYKLLNRNIGLERQSMLGHQMTAHWLVFQKVKVELCLYPVLLVFFFFFPTEIQESVIYFLTKGVYLRWQLIITSQSCWTRDVNSFSSKKRGFAGKTEGKDGWAEDALYAGGSKLDFRREIVIICCCCELHCTGKNHARKRNPFLSLLWILWNTEMFIIFFFLCLMVVTLFANLKRTTYNK